MKRVSALIYIAVFALVSAFSLTAVILCGGIDYSYYAVKKSPYIAPDSVTVYIGGAVQNEGYYTATIGCTYYELFSRAGLLTQSSSSYDYDEVYDGSTSRFILHYIVDTEKFFPLDVNSEYFISLAEYVDIDSKTAQRIGDFVASQGRIQDKSQLVILLGEPSYQQIFYKLYIGDGQGNNG